MVSAEYNRCRCWGICRFIRNEVFRLAVYLTSPLTVNLIRKVAETILSPFCGDTDLIPLQKGLILAQKFVNKFVVRELSSKNGQKIHSVFIAPCSRLY